MRSLEAIAGIGARRLAILVFGTSLIASAIGCGVPENEVHEREMVAAGRASFRAYCAGCHGPDARGDGPAATQLTVKPADLTQITTRYGTFPDEAIYDRIDGYNDPADSTVQMMPAWGNIWRGVNREWETQQDVRERINEIVAYLKTLQTTSS